MTVMTEQQVEVPAWMVDQGDVVYSPSLDDWFTVLSIRHSGSANRWDVVLTLDTGTPRDYFVVKSDALVKVAVP